MKFIVDLEVFAKLPDICFGVVIAKGLDNKSRINLISELLTKNISETKNQLTGLNIKEFGKIVYYRNAFNDLGFNPNKFLPSVEALVTRIVKGGQMPNINNIVDLVNAVSIKHIVPIGAHDIDSSVNDIEVRFSKEGDCFIPFGSHVADNPDQNELVYVRGNSVKTRRWIWRQSDIGKITEDSTNIFFPIDGFKTKNLQSVLASRDDLANQLVKYFNCEVKIDFVDIEKSSILL